MKILEIVVSSPPDKIYKEGGRGCSGYDFITFEIANKLANDCGNEVDLLTIVQFHDSVQYNKLNVIKNTKIDLIKNFNPLLFIKTILGYPNYTKNSSLLVMRDLIFQALILCKIKNLIYQNKYDVIHVHGMFFMLNELYSVAKSFSVPVLLTLHGLLSFNPFTNASEAIKRYERNFLCDASMNNKLVSFVSSGCISKVNTFLGVKHTPNFITTLNGCKINPQFNYKFDIRNRYGLDKETKIILYVGNISRQKNQQLALKAINRYVSQTSDNVKILFVGGVQKSYIEEWNSIINSTSIDNIVICGFVNQEEIGAYYTQADGVILVSESEGFGLSVIEGMSYGLPCVISSKMEIVPDVADSRCNVIVDNTIESVANGISCIVHGNWDKEYIYNKSLLYSKEAMVNRYNKVLSSLILKK